MNKYFNETLGFYESPFFRLHLGTYSGENLDINTMSNEDFAVFTHEYIHFLQAITTIYGLNQIHITVEYFKKALNTIYPTEGEFKVPISPEIPPKDNVTFNWRIFRLTQGDSDDSIKRVRRIVKIEFPEEIIDKDCDVESIHCVTLNVIDSTGEENLYSFGGVCIMESMAYMLEQCLSPKGFKGSSDLPYNSAMIAAQAIYPEFAKEPLNVLALCDISLQSSNPGYVFVQILRNWKDENKIPDAPEQLYDESYQIQREWQGKDRQDTLLPQLKEMSDFVKSQLFEYFKPDDDDPQGAWSKKANILRAWINAILQSAMDWRADHRAFILDMARGGPGKANKIFKEVFDDFGIPFCTNKSGHAFISHKIVESHRLDLDYFAAISQIFDTLNGQFKQCELFKLCELSGKPSADALCNTPWFMYRSETNPCPYAIMWRHWNLDGHIPINP